MSLSADRPDIMHHLPPDHLGRSLRADVRAGLTASPKTLPPKWFYDKLGSELFERITDLPEYYPTRAEREVLELFAAEMAATCPAETLIELGSGSSRKTPLLLNALKEAGSLRRYVAVDVSDSALLDARNELAPAFPDLELQAVAADFETQLHLLPRVGRRMVAFLGGTIGNFYPPAAIRLLSRVRHAMEGTDRLLLGVDLRKDVSRIEAAYNDSQGVTAEFNRNMLLVLNHELGADFDPAAFDHRAFYEKATHRIEMHLVSTLEHEVRIPGIGLVPFAQGESMRTEISSKYDRASVDELFLAAGLRIETWRPDPEALFALVVGVAG